MNASISPNKRILFSVLWSQSQNDDILNENEVENDLKSDDNEKIIGIKRDREGERAHMQVKWE